MIERVELFRNKKDLLTLFSLFILLCSLSLAYEYYNYKQLTKFDSALVEAKVLKQYTKTKLKTNGKTKTYQVLLLEADQGFKFYTIAKKDFPNVKDRSVQLEIFLKSLNFYEYMNRFFAFSKIEKVYKHKQNLKQALQQKIAQQHSDTNISALYQALYLASDLPYELRKELSNLGVSHLIAISGFHLGILSGVLFLLLKFPYRLLQNRYFPYRNIKRDLMILIAFTLLVYTLFLDSPPSLLRAFVMLVIGFILYDRGVKIISMQTLLLTVMLILAFFPRLFFSIGLWLSVAGVFFIFLFLLYFQDKKPVWNFILLPIFVYIMMLPFSLAIFGNFSLLHPLSIIYTTLFTLFYPLSFLLHLLGYGALLDPLLHSLLLSGKNGVEIEIDYKVLGAFIAIALGSIFSKRLFMLLSLFAFSIFIYAVNYVT